MMKICNIEASDMGTDQDQIADKVREYVQDIDFKSEQQFVDMESDLIKRACKELGWHSVPSVGGVYPNWLSQDGCWPENLPGRFAD